VLSLRHDEIRRSNKFPSFIDMASRKSCMEDDELSMTTMTHFSSSQTHMIATTHEDISGILDMIEDTCVEIVHEGYMDLQIQEERHELDPVDEIDNYKYEEREAPLLEILLLDQVVEIDSLIEYSPLGPAYSDEDAILTDRDDHILCLDTVVWDTGTYDINRGSTHEDTTSHIRYNVIQRGVAVGDGVQCHIVGLCNTMDNGQFSALCFVESVFGNSMVDTTAEGHDVAPQQDCDQDS
jgi:hypothetical protein